jgi:hypothetical protein
MYFRVVFHGQRGDVGVGDQIRAAARDIQALLKKVQMPLAWIKRHNVGILKPASHVARSCGKG